MPRHAGILLAALLVLVAACNDDDGIVTTVDEPVPSVVTSSPTTDASAPTTSSRPTTVPPPPATSTTTTPPETTAPPGTPPPPTTVPIGELTLRLEPVAEGFGQPVLVTAPAEDPRLFIVDQPGRIWVVDGDTVHEFLDIREDVLFQNEQGLLGLAFHPEYHRNGLFYVDFIAQSGGAQGDTVLAEFRVDPANPNAALADSRRDVLIVDQPASNHNGGMIAFGPDGLLWLGLGDGGGANDQFGNGQRADRLLASMIRIEVGPDAPDPYGVPGDGPFVADGGLPEVWAIGLRNPWRWTFDGGLLYIADVGQAAIEEINAVPAARGGLNYGWSILEGDDCFRSADCDRSGLKEPVVTYPHADGCSVTGGFVYRGESIPELTGHYFFGDYCSGWVESLVVDDEGALQERREWLSPGSLPGLTSFGRDSSGELYVMTSEGTVYRFVRG